MKALDIIDLLIRCGDTRAMGIVETPSNPMEITDWLVKTFGSSRYDVVSSKELKHNTKYLYVYDKQISTETIEDCKLDMKFVLTDDRDRIIWTHAHEIYLYEIE